MLMPRHATPKEGETLVVSGEAIRQPIVPVREKASEGPAGPLGTDHRGLRAFCRCWHRPDDRGLYADGGHPARDRRRVGRVLGEEVHPQLLEHPGDRR